MINERQQTVFARLQYCLRNPFFYCCRRTIYFINVSRLCAVCLQIHLEPADAVRGWWKGIVVGEVGGATRVQ